MANDEHLHKAFSFFDKNQSGYIEIEELRNALNDDDETNGEDVINAIMHDVDTDKVSFCSIHKRSWNISKPYYDSGPSSIVLYIVDLQRTHVMFSISLLQDGRISYEEFAAMMKAGTDWRKASRQYSRERFNSLSLKLMRDGSLHLTNEARWITNLGSWLILWTWMDGYWEEITLNFFSFFFPQLEYVLLGRTDILG